MGRSFLNNLNIGVMMASGVVALTACKGPQKEISKSKPNIIYLLFDDLGYGELGAYGQEKIETPNIDQLAQDGIRFTQHYSGSPVCAPSRCVLLTGKHSGHAYIRGNDEWAERGEVWDFRKSIKDPHLEGQRPIPAGTETIGRMLQRVGYKTACIGKWGLGAPGTEGVASKQGFDFFFGYNCQRQAHTYYPVHLWKNEKKVLLDNEVVPPHTKLAKDADPNDPKSYAQFELKEYAPDLMFKESMQFLEENKDQPFFMYLSTPIPHVPLQAPKKWVDHYRMKFGEEEPYTGKKGYFPCQYPHATYAAMISYIDEQMGKMVKRLKELGIYENTLIIVTSDNGPTFNGGSDSPWFDSARPFKSERGWGKVFLREGGIRIPMIALWPGKIKPGTTTDHPSAFYDVMPTLAEITGATIQGETDGISFLPSLLGEKNQKVHDYLYWEFNGGQTARKGKWKIFRPRAKKKPEEAVKLYNLEEDPREQKDVAAENPEIVKEMIQILNTAHTKPVEDWQQKWDLAPATN